MEKLNNPAQIVNPLKGGSALLADASYNPNAFVDALISRLALKNDAALCRKLDVAPPVISKVRHKRLPVSPALLLRVHDASGLAVDELRELMGVKDAYRSGQVAS